MNQETATQETQAPAADAAPASAPAAPPKAPAVKLTLRHNGKDHPLLKYPFPVKAPRYKVTVNGTPVDAATTAGKGKAYTYLLINNTSFYIAGVLAADAATEVNFPDGYKFDDTVAQRVSTYKPKKKPAVVAVNGSTEPAPAEAAAAAEPAAEAAPVEPIKPDAPKAARRGK